MGSAKHHAIERLGQKHQLGSSSRDHTRLRVLDHAGQHRVISAIDGATFVRGTDQAVSDIDVEDFGVEIDRHAAIRLGHRCIDADPAAHQLPINSLDCLFI